MPASGSRSEQRRAMVGKAVTVKYRFYCGIIPHVDWVTTIKGQTPTEWRSCLWCFYCSPRFLPGVASTPTSPWLHCDDRENLLSAQQIKLCSQYNESYLLCSRQSIDLVFLFASAGLGENRLRTGGPNNKRTSRLNNGFFKRFPPPDFSLISSTSLSSN